MGLFSRQPTAQLQVDSHLAGDLPLIEAAHAGAAQGLGDRLAELRAQGRWHHRHQLIARAASPDRGTGWIEDWARQSTGNQDALTTRAVTEVRIARSSDDRQRLLSDASLVLEAARDRSPADPTAWSALFDQAHGLGHGAERVRELVMEAEAASPGGFAWRATVVELLSARWHGTTEESWDFAVGSVEVDPQSRLVLLPSYAALSVLRREPDELAEQMLAEALPPARNYLESCRIDEAEYVEAVSSIAARLVAATRRREAPAYLELLGDRVDSVVWSTVVGPDPVGVFTQARRTFRSS
ncbi:hypothetical protein [Nocardioides sp. W7]|uniref:hypothetical protein n=1 Tax=Nocardioides sp. W7 TaxID=2931390 RepID=UPI001FD09B53|nr:hypothetical protein [Nocardioides sp. W7]